MLEIEKIKRNNFLFALDDSPIDLSFIISSVRRNLKNSDQMGAHELNLKVLDYIKYLFKNNLFEVGQEYYQFKKWDLNSEEILLKIKMLLESDKDPSLKYFFNLTTYGREEADEYFNKLNIIREKTLLLCENNYLNIQAIISLIKEIFETNDLEEIEHEFLESISSLTDWHFIETGIIYNGEFLTYGRLQDYQLKEKIKTDKEFEIKNDIYFRITVKGKLVLDEWKKSGGRISDHFNKIIFSKY